MVRLLAAGGTGTSQHDRPVVLRLPLRPLEPRDLAPQPTRAPLPRTLDLEPGALMPWLAAVAASEDACAVVDADGRLAAMSQAASVLLDLDDDRVGARFSDLVSAVDFSLGARPDPQGLPPLQALESGRTARALLRLRHRDAALVTLDVVSVPLARRVGSLSFLQQV